MITFFVSDPLKRNPTAFHFNYDENTHRMKIFKVSFFFNLTKRIESDMSQDIIQQSL